MGRASDIFLLSFKIQNALGIPADSKYRFTKTIIARSSSLSSSLIATVDPVCERWFKPLWQCPLRHDPRRDRHRLHEGFFDGVQKSLLNAWHSAGSVSPPDVNGNWRWNSKNMEPLRWSSAGVSRLGGLSIMKILGWFFLPVSDIRHIRNDFLEWFHFADPVHPKPPEAEGDPTSGLL